MFCAASLSLGLLAVPATAAPADPERYIVTFTEASTDSEIAATRERAVNEGAQIVYDYTDAIRGFAAVLNFEAYADLAQDPAVADISADEVVRLSDVEPTATAVQSSNLTAALDRIDQKTPALDGLFHQVGTGRGVRAYVVDTGIEDHDDFGDRVAKGFDIEGGAERGRTDCNGHGTHVAGTLGGSTVGVAKQVELVPVRVFDCKGSTGVSSVIAGLDWAVRDFKKRDLPAVLNLSLSVEKSDELDGAVEGVIAAGLPVVAAAGNDGGNACNVSPARVSPVITVGAVTVSDQLADFSNSGGCVDLYAPGVAIYSTNYADSNEFVPLSGTSMAAPHVSGVIAAYLEHNPTARPGTVRTVLVGAATRGLITGGLRAGSSNRLLYSMLPDSNRPPKISTPTASLPGVGGEIRTGAVPVKVSWTAADPDGDRIEAYRVQRSYDGGASWATVATAGSGTKAVKVWVRPDSRLRFRVRATDERGLAGSNATTPTMRLALLQESSAGLGSTWNRETGRKLSGGTERIAGRRGAALTLSFTGSRLRWIGSTGRDRGRARVYLDGTYLGTVDTYAGERAVRRVLFSASMKPGRHTLRLVLTGTKRSKAADDRVAADAFVVLD